MNRRKNRCTNAGSRALHRTILPIRQEVRHLFEWYWPQPVRVPVPVRIEKLVERG